MLGKMYVEVSLSIIVQTLMFWVVTFVILVGC
jgi:hypothetical protein